MRASVVAIAWLAASAIARAESPPYDMVGNDDHDGSAPPLLSPTLAAETTIAARLTAPFGPVSVTRIDLWFGGAASQHTVTIKLWDDSAGTLEPGPELHSEDVLISGEPRVQSIWIFASPLPAQFRLGVVLHHAELPTIGRDTNGTRAPDGNFLRMPDGTWLTTQTAGLDGDWILRAQVSYAHPDPLPSSPDAAQSATCSQDSDCAPHQRCDQGTCAMPSDETAENGCGCRTDRGAAPSALALALATLVLATRRRRT